MKRVLTILAILLLPLSVWAMTPVSDSDLSNVTGQSGVNINADLTMNIGIGTMSWGDTDGIGSLTALGWETGTTAGYIGVTNFNLTNLRIKARETDQAGVYYTSAMLKPITIDVATGVKLGNATTYVRFGLGSLQITMDAMSMNVVAGTNNALSAGTQILGSVNIGAMSMMINPRSFVDIYGRAGSGVNFEFGVILDRFDIGYVSWGDLNGMPAGNPGNGVGYWFAPGSGAGYVGLQNLQIGAPITITGTVSIDVVTSTSTVSVYNHGSASPVSIVHIGFPTNFAIGVGPISASVNLSNVATLTPGVGTGNLGDIYISGLNINILSGSWVDIWAH